MDYKIKKLKVSSSRLNIKYEVGSQKIDRRFVNESNKEKESKRNY